MKSVLLAIMLVSLSEINLAQEHEKKPTVLIAASNMRHPPFSSWGRDQQAMGVEIDIVNAAARRINSSVQFVEREFGELIDAIADGQIDLAVSTIGRTEERAKFVAFSKPYYKTQIIALVAQDSKYQELASLAKCRIGADKATTSYSVAIERWPQATFVTEPSAESNWPNMVQQGTVDAFIVDASDQERLETESGVSLRRLPEPIAKEEFCVAVSKSNPDLLAAINLEVATFEPTIAFRVGHEYQMTTVLGRKIYSVKHPARKLVDDYFKAAAAFASDPSPDATIWLGRRAGYLGRMNDAIRIFSEGIKRHPNDPRLYRHRGHRYISIRQFDRAIKDLEHAVGLIKDQSNQVEPDGAPNPKGIPLTTTHGNIWYHLGLAYYLKNDMRNALRCYNQRIALEKNDDNKVANAYWRYMILRRMGRPEMASQAVQDIGHDMTIIENMSYHEMCLFFNKTRRIEDMKLTTDGESAQDVLLYGVGNWFVYDQDNHQEAKLFYEKLFANGAPYSFAFIAAETDFVRLFESERR